MTTDSDFKALVRARMALTGQTYTAARADVIAERGPAADPHQPGPTAPETDLQRSADDAFYGKTVRSFFDGDRLRAILSDDFDPANSTVDRVDERVDQLHAVAEALLAGYEGQAMNVYCQAGGHIAGEGGIFDRVLATAGGEDEQAGRRLWE